MGEEKLGSEPISLRLECPDAFLDCVTGPSGGLLGGCEKLDFDGDGDVDFDDFGVFQIAFTGQ